MFDYVQDDGSTVRELRHPDDVFHADSLASLASAPVTDLHPPEPVTADNAATYLRGFGSETPRRDGQFVASDVTVTDGGLIAKIDTRGKNEISLGYTCRIVKESGVFQGERYDQRQTHIRYNHIAIGPSGWGRAGSDVSMRLDGGAARFDDLAESVPSSVHMDTVEIRIDGGTVTVAKASADTVTRLDAVLAQAKADLAKANADLGATKAELGTVKDALAQATDAAAIAKRVDARIALVQDAAKVLGADYRADGKSDAEVMRAAIAKARPEMKLDGQGDDFVAGAFRIVCDSVGVDSLKTVREPEAPAVREDAAALRAARTKAGQDAWKHLGKGNVK